MKAKAPDDFYGPMAQVTSRMTPTLIASSLESSQGAAVARLVDVTATRGHRPEVCY